MEQIGIPAIVAAAVFLFTLMSYCVYVIRQYERGVVFTFGKLAPEPKSPGLRFIVPGVQKLLRVDTRTITMDIPSQDVITRDNVSVKVSAVLYFRVIDVNRAIVQVENYHYATSQLAQTTLRSVCGGAELDDLLTKREEINQRIAKIIDDQTEPWGVKVTLVEVKHIDLPQEMQRAMAKQAEAERERRAKIIQAEGEFQAAEKLKDAAHILSQESMSLQLRYLETLRQIATEQHSTVLFPVPLEFMQGLMKKLS